MSASITLQLHSDTHLGTWYSYDKEMLFKI